MLGVYIHIPFCASICNYCNFNRSLLDPDLKRRYVDALVTEIGRVDAGPSPVADTVFFGGGTPSLLTPDEVSRILEACRQRLTLTADAEVTLEANPETVSEALLRGYREAGVTRLSIGVQSFRDDELRRLSRRHGAARAHEAVAQARAAGFDNLSLDLMMWLPGQSPAAWLESVDAAITLTPEHLSLYMLEVYPNAPLRDEMARAQWSQAPDEEVAEMYLTAMARLERAGLQQYEISNVARDGRQCRHNRKYWTDGDWLALGCGAHGRRDGIRTRVVSGTDDFIARVAAGASTTAETRPQSVEERLGDALFTGLRLIEGVDVSAVGTRYGVDVWQRYGGALAPYLEEGLVVREGDRLRLPPHGMLLAHEVMAVFV